MLADTEFYYLTIRVVTRCFLRVGQNACNLSLYLTPKHVFENFGEAIDRLRLPRLWAC